MLEDNATHLSWCLQPHTTSCTAKEWPNIFYRGFSKICKFAVQSRPWCLYLNFYGPLLQSIAGRFVSCLSFFLPVNKLGLISYIQFIPSRCAILALTANIQKLSVRGHRETSEPMDGTRFQCVTRRWNSLLEASKWWRNSLSCCYCFSSFHCHRHWLRPFFTGLSISKGPREHKLLDSCFSIVLR